MQIIINQRPVVVEEEVSLKEALNTFDLAQKGIAVAVNSVVIPNDKWQECVLEENDEIMIIRATQGG
jgi:sulfur carrier protein